MKRLVKILLFVIVTGAFFFGGVFGYKKYRISTIKYSGVYQSLFDGLGKKKPELLGKKYFYVNVWDKTCKPCIAEMPELDLIAQTIKKDVGFIFVTDDSDSETAGILERKKFAIKNFVFLNEMDDFIIGVMKEKKVNSLPIHLIIDSEGKILFCQTGRMEFSFNGNFSPEERKRLNELSKPGFVKFIDKLPE
jgi:thiol-disulfide isomerase/thioredoxin